MTAPTDSPVIVGRIGRPWGVNGDMYITPLTDFPDRFLGIKEILVAQPEGWTAVPVISSRLVNGRPILRLAGVGSPEEAARLTNRDLAVARDQVVSLPDGSYFVFDLIGCEVVDSQNGRAIGKLVDVRRYPANDVYVIQEKTGQTRLLAAVVAFVKAVDIRAGRVTIDPAGLVDAS